MSQTTNVKQVKMNIMTQQQYTQATKDPTELYMVTDAELYDAFTGADGTNAGTSGLVPAPTATDNTKYLKGDGTWGAIDPVPPIATSVSASSTNAETVGAKLFYDTVGDIETLLSQV